RNHIQSIRIYAHQRPGAPSNPSPASGTVYAASTTSLDLSFEGADEVRIHVWGNNYDSWRDWGSSKTIHLTGLTSGVYSWQAQSRNVMGEGPWSPVWTFTINQAPEVVLTSSVHIFAGQTIATTIGSWDPEGGNTSITAVSNLP